MKSIWNINENALEAELTFSSFKEAMDFMFACVNIISEHNHHPNWSNVYKQVHISLTTHDAGNTITEKDRKLAQAIEELYWQTLS